MKRGIALGTVILGGLAAAAYAHTLMGPWRDPHSWRLDQMSDGEKLFLFERLRIGSPIADAFRVAPGLEYASRHRAYRTSTSLFGRDAYLSVSDAGDTVRAWHYRVATASKAEGDSLMDLASAFYASYFGPPAAEEGADPDHYSVYHGWCWPSMNLMLSHSFNGDGPSFLTVGVQSRCAHGVPFELLKGPRVWPYVR